MHINVIGVDHHKADISIRERLAFTPEQLPSVLTSLGNQLLDHQTPAELVVVSTCNRVEVYFASAYADASNIVLDFLARHAAMTLDDLQHFVYQYQDIEVAQHLFEVVSGMQSMVIGETQIAGQIKQAFALSEELNLVGIFFHQLFQRSFRAAKDIRSLTSIGAKIVSIPSMVVKLSERIFGDIKELNLMFVGAGEMIEHCADYLIPLRPKSVVVLNRTPKNAEILTQNWSQIDNIQIKSLDGLEENLPNVDLVISSTAAKDMLIKCQMVENALKKRRFKPLLLVDLAVPRDIDPQVAQMQDVFLYSMDDLGALIQRNIESRAHSLVDARELVSKHCAEWQAWLESRNVATFTRDMINNIERMRIMELAKATKKLDRESAETVMDGLTKNLINKMLHGLLSELHSANETEQEFLKKLYDRLFRHLSK